LESSRGGASTGSYRCTLPSVPKTPEADQLEFSASYSFEREDALYDLKRDLKIAAAKNALIATLTGTLYDCTCRESPLESPYAPAVRHPKNG
jgi:hypothetical protein